jgi:O-antigen/teichoic acid export membrane protein
MSAPDTAAATGGRRIVYHSFLNIVGTGSPLLVAVFAIPILIDRLGTERFGVLTIVWMLIGYLSLFDFGIGRALTKLVAERLGSPQRGEVPGLLGTGLVLMVGLGLVGAVFTAAVAPRVVDGVLMIPPELRQETLHALYLLAVALPVVTLTTGLRGALEAYHRFDLVNAVRTPLGIFTFAGPLLVLPFSIDLAAIVGVLLVGRGLAAAVQWAFIRRIVPETGSGLRLDRASIPVLLRFGGWMTVSSTISPLMVYMDRFLIGALLGMTAVAYYATPYEIVTKLWLIPTALLAVLFPAFSAGIRERDPQMPRLFGHALLAVFLVLAPVTLALVTYGNEALRLWVGDEFASNSTVVLQWLAVGVLINSLAQVPFTVLQGGGRPDITAKLHLVELPVYLAGFWYLTGRFGIEGAAIAWVLRVGLDALFLFAMVPRALPNTGHWIRRIAIAFAFTLVVLTVGSLLTTPVPKAVFFFGILATGLPAAWMLLVSAPDRVAALARARGLWAHLPARRW